MLFVYTHMLGILYHVSCICKGFGNLLLRPVQHLEEHCPADQSFLYLVHYLPRPASQIPEFPLKDCPMHKPISEEEKSMGSACGKIEQHTVVNRIQPKLNSASLCVCASRGQEPNRSFQFIQGRRIMLQTISRDIGFLKGSKSLESYPTIYRQD